LFGPAPAETKQNDNYRKHKEDGFFTAIPCHLLGAPFLKDISFGSVGSIRMGEMRNAYRILVGKPEGNRPLGRPRPRWMNNIKIDPRETEWDGMDWIDLAQDRDQWRALVNTMIKLEVP
jgi:hypothetical protein